MNFIDVKSAAKLIEDNNNFLILCHKFPDGDTLGCASALSEALKQMGKNVKIFKPTSTKQRLEFLLNGLCGNSENFEEKFIIAVDVADVKLLEEPCQKYKDKINLCIDHHASNKLFAKNLLLDKNASAACEIIFNLLKELKVNFNKKIINALYTGISTDTGCFMYSNVTPNTFEIAAKLLQMGAEAAKINKIMFDTKSLARVKLEAILYSNLETYFNGKCTLAYVTQEIIEKTQATEDDLDGLASLPRKIEGTEVSIYLREKENYFKASIRTNGKINANAICEKLGGGGHICAAGCELPNNLKVAKEMILKAVKEEGSALLFN